MLSPLTIGLIALVVIIAIVIIWWYHSFSVPHHYLTMYLPMERCHCYAPSSDANSLFALKGVSINVSGRLRKGDGNTVVAASHLREKMAQVLNELSGHVVAERKSIYSMPPGTLALNGIHHTDLFIVEREPSLEYMSEWLYKRICPITGRLGCRLVSVSVKAEDGARSIYSRE